MKSLAALAALSALFCSPAFADGLYLEANIGQSFATEADVSGAPLDGQAEFKDAVVYGGAIGYQLHNARTELNVSYRKTDLDDLTVQGVRFDGAGNVQILTALINAYYDFDLGGGFRPYVGAGIGTVWAEIDSDDDAPLIVNDNVAALVWSVMAGIGFAVSNHVDLVAGYRYLQTSELNYDASLRGVAGIGSLESEFAAHEVVAGIRYRF